MWDRQISSESLGFSQESANRKSKKCKSEGSKEYCWVPNELKKCLYLYKILTTFTLCGSEGIPVLQPSWAFPSFCTKGTAFHLLPLRASTDRQCLADIAVLYSLALLLQEPTVFQGDGTPLGREPPATIFSSLPVVYFGSRFPLQLWL